MEQVSQVTPAEAVEAALAALEDHVDAKECCARAALEAAAPHMLAEAWDEGKRAWGDERLGKACGTNPYRPTP